MKFSINSSIPIKFEKTTNNNEDDRYIKVKTFIAHEGLNLNQSYFSKEVLELMGQKLGGVPIVGYVAENNDGNNDFKGHEMKIVVNEDGIDYVYLGSAFGCVLDDNNAHFEIVKCDDGVERNYLCCDAILWKKFNKYTDIFERDGYKSQSMELLPSSIQGNFAEDNAFHFTDAIVEALCALGEGVNPAMKNSIIEKYSLSTIKDQMREMFDELKEFATPSNKVKIISIPSTRTEWECPHCNHAIGEKELYFNGESWFHRPCQHIGEIVFSDDDKKQLEFNYKDDLNFQNNSKEDEVVPDVKTKTQVAEQFSLTVNQLYEELDNKVSELKYKGKNWYGDEVEYSKYYMKDFDENYVYAVDRQNNYQNVKMTYSKSGDDVSIDFESASRIKWSPVDWEGSDEEVVMENFTVKILEEVKKDFDKAIEEKNDISSKFEKQADSLLELNDKYSALESSVAEKESVISSKDQELETLKEFKLKIEQDERQDKVGKLFEKYKKNLTKEDVDSFKEKESTYEKFEEFERDVKLFVADKVAENISTNSTGNENTQFTQMGLNQNRQDNISDEPKSVWDRLEESNK